MQSTEDLIQDGLGDLGKNEQASPAAPAGPNQPVEKTVEVEEGWFHHFMHHGGTMITAGGFVLVALIGLLGIWYKHKNKKTPGNSTTEERS